MSQAMRWGNIAPIGVTWWSWLANLAIQPLPARCSTLQLAAASPGRAGRCTVQYQGNDVQLMNAWVGIVLPMAWGMWMILDRLWPLMASVQPL